MITTPRFAEPRKQSLDIMELALDRKKRCDIERYDLEW